MSEVEAHVKQEPDSLVLVQQQLVLILHAHTCRKRGNHQCDLPYCSTMKDVLQHMTTCLAGEDCPHVNCASSRSIILHWINCTRDICAVCEPLKNIQNNPGWTTPRRTNLTLELGSFLARGSQEGPSSQGPIGGPGSQQGPPPPPTGAVGGAVGAHLFGGQAVPGGNPTEFGGFPPPALYFTQADWHQGVTQDVRNHVAGKVVKAIFPHPFLPGAMHDQRIRDIIAYADLVEKELFATSNSMAEYCHLIAHRIFEIQKVMQLKREKREKLANEQRQLEQGGSTGQQVPQHSNLNAGLVLAYEGPSSGPVDQEGPSSGTVHQEGPSSGPVDLEGPSPGQVDQEDPSSGPVDQEDPSSGPVDHGASNSE